jgi:hypothetical protein
VLFFKAMCHRLRILEQEETEATEKKRREETLFSLCFAKIIGPMDARVLNAKARRREGAKRKAEIGKAEMLCRFASLRLGDFALKNLF